MDIKKLTSGILDRIGQYKYVLVVIFAGIVLMLLPGKNSQIQIESQQTQQNIPVANDISQQLEEILSHIHGVGKVKVLLSVAKGEQTLYQTDNTCAESEGRKDTKSQTVILTDGSRTEMGLIYQRNPPVYLGAVILAQGAENAQVKLLLVDAVSKVTGLGADKISVMKMK